MRFELLEISFAFAQSPALRGATNDAKLAIALALRVERSKLCGRAGPTAWQSIGTNPCVSEPTVRGAGAAQLGHTSAQSCS